MTTTYDPIPLIEGMMIVAMPIMFAFGFLASILLVNLLNK